MGNRVPENLAAILSVSTLVSRQPQDVQEEIAELVTDLTQRLAAATSDNARNLALEVVRQAVITKMLDDKRTRDETRN
jgi:DNA-directed RNA polymerase